MKGYRFWISYGEIELQQHDFRYSNSEISKVGGLSHINNGYNEFYVDRIEYMIGDAINANQNVRDEESSTCREPFYNIVQAAQQSLYDGCSTHSELSTAVRLLSIKSDYNMPQNCFNEIVQLMNEVCPPNNRVPNNYEQTKKVLKDLGNDVVRIDYCRKGCMLFFKDDINLDACMFCEYSR